MVASWPQRFKLGQCDALNEKYITNYWSYKPECNAKSDLCHKEGVPNDLRYERLFPGQPRFVTRCFQLISFRAAPSLCSPSDIALETCAINGAMWSCRNLCPSCGCPGATLGGASQSSMMKEIVEVFETVLQE